MNRRSVDGLVGLVQTGVLAVGLYSAWNAYRQNQAVDGMMGGVGGWGMAGIGLWGLGFLWSLLIVGLAIVVGTVLVTRAGNAEGDRALELLRERFASGELSDAEYATRREAIER